MRKLKVGDVYEIYDEEEMLYQVVDIQNYFLISKVLSNKNVREETTHCYCEYCWDTYNFIVNPDDWWE